jgi:hypothetical protein
MGQEFFINSQTLQDKVSSLLPSQGGAGAGVDLSASTTIIPIVDLTESAQGSNLRQDLQTAFSHGGVTTFEVQNQTTTLLSQTGYFRIFGTTSLERTNTANGSQALFILNDGVSDKVINKIVMTDTTTSEVVLLPFDFTIFLAPQDSFKVQAINNATRIIGCTRQVASITGELVNPI